MAWPWKWSKWWCHTPQGVEFPVDRSVCPWRGSSLYGNQIHQLEGFSLSAVRGPGHWPQCSPPACSVCPPCCQDSPLSLFFHGHSLKATALAQEWHLHDQKQTTRRPHHTVHTAYRFLFCLGNDVVGAHVECCVVTLWEESCELGMGSGSGSVQLRTRSCPQVHPAGG